MDDFDLSPPVYENGTRVDSDAIPVDTIIGVILAFSSCFFIGVSVIFKKVALKEVEEFGHTRAVDGGYGYLKLPKWWLGITLMALGELTNFVAYIYAPAILVTPLGVFSIVCTAALSPYFLNEKLGLQGKLGCLLVLVGCTIVTLCGPKDREVSTMNELQNQLLNPGFLIYSSLVVLVSLILMSLVPKYGHKFVMFYITICSSFGSLSVMFCKGVGLALKQTIAGKNQFTHWATWVCLICLIICLLIETVYMQKALDLFSSSVFMSVNYVMFTSLVIVASSILYTELRELGAKNIVLTILGFVVNITSLYMLHLDKSPKSVENHDCVKKSDDNENIQQATPLLDKMKYDKLSIENEKNLNVNNRNSPLTLGINIPGKIFRETDRSNSYASLLTDSASDRKHNEQNDCELHKINCFRLNSNPENYQTMNETDAITKNQHGSMCMCGTPLITDLQSSVKHRNCSGQNTNCQNTYGDHVNSRPSSEETNEDLNYCADLSRPNI